MTSLRTSLPASLGFAALVGIAASPALGAGGADPASAVAISALPFADTGDTTGGSDDWDAACPYDGSTSPDHWYTYTPAGEETVDIALCESAYDTKLYILDSGFVQVACVDDSCSSSGGGGFRSSIENADLTSGELYYIVIDGYLGSSGVYDVTMNLHVPPPPCIFTECNATPEGEPCDDSDAPDTVNGGCNGTPAVFGSLGCDETICGTAWALGDNRDTDWYEVNMDYGTLVSQIVTAEAALTIFALTGISNGICGDVAVSQSSTLEPCIEGTISQCYEVGDAYFWVGHSDFDTLPCGSEYPGNDYVMSISCSMAPPIPCCDLGDANEDGDIGFADLIILFDNWGSCGTPSCCTAGDSNEDGEIDFADLLNLLANWDNCGHCQ